jgi:hypothetical protein
MYNSTTGRNNTTSGLQSLYYDTTGSNVTALGYQAAYGSATYSHSNGVFLGYKAGYGNSTGDNNIAIGFQAGDNVTTGSSNITIGYDINAVSATTSNQLNIGNLIYGTSLDGTNATLSSGNIGIGATSPSAKLFVNGSMLVHDTILFNAEYSNTSSSSILVDWNSGNRQYIRLAHDNITIKFKEPTSQKPGNFILVIEQDGTGGRDVTTWKNGNCLNVDVKWPGGTNPDLSDTVRGIDAISCIYRYNTYTSNGEFLCVPSLDFSV